MKERRTKRWAILGMILVLILIFPDLLRSESTPMGSAGLVLKRILQKGELVVGMSGDIPPFTMKSKEGKVIGLDADLAADLATGMGVKLRIAVIPFSELLTAIENGKVDMILSAMTITPERNLRVAFIGPYFISGQAILTKGAKLASMKVASEINSPKTRIAALKGSTSQFYIEKAIPKAKLVATLNNDEAVEMVIEDKVDAVVADFPACIVSVFRYPNKGLASLMTPLTYEPLGIALPTNDPLLINWVENCLRTHEGAGSLKMLKARWFENSTWLAMLP